MMEIKIILEILNGNFFYKLQTSLLKETAKLEKLVKQEDDSLTEEKQQVRRNDTFHLISNESGLYGF